MDTICDMTGRCATGPRKSVRPGDLCAIWIHRTGPSIGADAVAISRFFTNGPGAVYTGGGVPYHYINTYHRVEQALPLDVRGAHARRWGNLHGIGFAQLGDFRRHPPSLEQWMRAVDVCAELLPLLNKMPPDLLRVLPRRLQDGPPIFGHGEVPGSYGGNSKSQPDGPEACPGKLWSMVDFRREVEARRRELAAIALAANGHRLACGR